MCEGDMTIEIDELIEVLKECICYPYGAQPYIDAQEFLSALYCLKARKEEENIK
jgi:hypothetical protein